MTVADRERPSLHAVHSEVLPPASRWHALREYLRWRSSAIVTLLIFREILRPILSWQLLRIFETDVSKEVPGSYAADHLEIRICGPGQDANSLAEAICSMGQLSQADVNSRRSLGHIACLAVFENQPVGYMWLAISSGPELAFDTHWLLRPKEGVRYNSFVVPSFRGRGTHSFLNASANRYAREHGLTRTLSSVSVLNSQSLSLARHFKRAAKMTVFLAHIRGTRWTFRKSFGAPLETHFTWPARRKM